MSWKAAILGLAVLALSGGVAVAGTPAQWRLCTAEQAGDSDPDAVIAACTAFISPPAKARGGLAEAGLAEARGDRAYAYWRKGDLDAAEADLRAALAIDATRERERTWLARLLLQRAGPFDGAHDPVRARAYATEALALLGGLPETGTSAEVLRLAAGANEHLGRFEASINFYSVALSLEPDNADLFNARCFDRAIRQVGLVYALSDCDRALALAPKVGEFRDSRGWVLLAMGRPLEAVAEFTAALDLGPKTATSTLGRALAERALGRAAEADADLAAARAIDPDVAPPYRPGPPEGLFDYGPGFSQAFAAVCLSPHDGPDGIFAAAKAAGWDDWTEEATSKDNLLPPAEVQRSLQAMPRFADKSLGPGSLRLTARTTDASPDWVAQGADPGRHQSCAVGFDWPGDNVPVAMGGGGPAPAVADLGGRAAELMGRAPTVEMQGVALWIWQDGPQGRRFLAVGADLSFVDADPALPIHSLGYSPSRAPEILMLMDSEPDAPPAPGQGWGASH